MYEIKRVPVALKFLTAERKNNKTSTIDWQKGIEKEKFSPDLEMRETQKVYYKNKHVLEREGNMQNTKEETKQANKSKKLDTSNILHNKITAPVSFPSSSEMNTTTTPAK